MLLNEKAGLLEKLKQYQQALQVFDLIISREPKAWAYYNRGVIKYQSGDKKGAISDYDIAIRIDPQYADVYYNRGIDKSELRNNKLSIFNYEIANYINHYSLPAQKL